MSKFSSSPRTESALVAIACLMLASCSTHRTVGRDDIIEFLAAQPEPGFISIPIDEFRERSPVPDCLLDAIGAYSKANGIVLDEAIDGLHVDVVIRPYGGGEALGYSEFFNGLPRGLREVRSGYEAVLVGDKGCIRYGDGSWACEPMEYDIGMRAVDVDRVFACSIEDETSVDGGTPVRNIRIRMADGFETDEGKFASATPDEDYYEFGLSIDRSGRPIWFSEVHFVRGKIVGPFAKYTPDYARPVTFPSLPAGEPAN